MEWFLRWVSPGFWLLLIAYNAFQHLFPNGNEPPHDQASGLYIWMLILFTGQFVIWTELLSMRSQLKNLQDMKEKTRRVS